MPAPDYVEILPIANSCGEGQTCGMYVNPPRTQQDGSVSSVCVPANAVVEWDAVAAEYDNSQNDSATITFDVYRFGVAGCEFIDSGSASTGVNSLPPCDATGQSALG